MKKYSTFILLGAIFIKSLHADISDPAFPPEELNPEMPQMGEEDAELSGNFIDINGDIIGRAKIKKKDSYRGHLTFADVDLYYTKVVHYNPCKKEGVFVQAGYEYDRLDWNENPFFNQTNFNNISFGLGFFSKRSDRWDFKGNIIANFDAERANVAGYATFDYLLWGRYTWCRDIGLHFGFLGLSGFKVDRVYPILGFDWKIDDRWTLNAIFPIDCKLLWKWDQCWSIALGSRFWDSIHRVGKHEELSKGVWEYRSLGFEGVIIYNWKGLNGNVHVGYNCGGRLRISNKHTRHVRRITFDGAPYAGAELGYHF